MKKFLIIETHGLGGDFNEGSEVVLAASPQAAASKLTGCKLTAKRKFGKAPGVWEVFSPAVRDVAVIVVQL